MYPPFCACELYCAHGTSRPVPALGGAAILLSKVGVRSAGTL